MSDSLEALSRTLLLLRDHVPATVDDQTLLEALTSTKVAVVGGAENLKSESAQHAAISVALLCARWGARVYLALPDARLIGVHTPLKGDRLGPALMEILRDLIPGIEGVEGPPSSPVDIAVVIGDSKWSGRATRVVYLDADAWTGSVSAQPGCRWSGYGVPFGPLVAAGLAAGEAFKAAMVRVAPHVRDLAAFEALFQPSREATLRLAPRDTPPPPADLGDVDCISGGAIAQAALYSLARISGVSGRVRLIEPERSDVSNLNRYALLTRSRVGELKAVDIGRLGLGGLLIDPVLARYDRAFRETSGPPSPAVIVGVDDIPSRWEVQAAHPQWLGLGATSHYSCLVSYHADGLACAGCLHPRDEADMGQLPTVSFVSHFAGLFLASFLARERMGAPPPLSEQSIYFTSLRAESPAALWIGPVPRLRHCPLACSSWS